MPPNTTIEPRELLRRFKNSLLSLDRIAGRDLALHAGALTSPMQFVETVIVPVMEQIGVDWENGDVSLSQIYMGGRICEQLVDEIMPPTTEIRKTLPRMAICVLDDFHMMGKRIVYTLLRSGGYHLVDYGRVTTDEVVARVREDGIEVLLVSVLMLASAIEIGNLTNQLRRAGASTRVVVGGAPFRFDEALWREVGADAVGTNASDALGIVADIARGRV